MIALVTGGRGYLDRAAIWAALDEARPTLVIQGGATGADDHAGTWAKARGVSCITMDAAWPAFPQDAGRRRNGWMLGVGTDLAAAREEELVCFAFPGHTGTKNMAGLAAKNGVKVRRFGEAS